MSYTSVKLIDGTSVIVSNSVRKADTADSAVSDDVMAADTSLLTVFFAALQLGLDPVPVVEYVVTSNRMFTV